MPKPKEPFTGTSFQGFLILDGEAQLWTSSVFNTESDAEIYMHRKQQAFGWDLSKHTIVPCTATVRITTF
ncbi:MAG TPA: hypothetical protein VF443_10245 [Nitrospira sp.]